MIGFLKGTIEAVYAEHIQIDVNGIGFNVNMPLSQIEGLDGTATQEIDADTPLEEMGTVYMDPETGKYYVMEE